MEVVAQLRALTTESARSKLSTQTGIFSIACTSFTTVRDVVTDSTIDPMHIKFCGTTRYLLSWVTDYYIPKHFTWDQLNEKKRAYPFKRGVRVPDLARTDGKNRASCSIHLSAAETMYFALARCARPSPLAAQTL